jgi:ATPase subunit of ABC transporter with duplicated ATPase domains
VHELPPEPRDDLLVLRNVSAKSGSRLLFAPIDVCIGRQRVGVVGANGTGKTTLLQIMLGRRRPATGSVVRSSRVGSIEQGGTDWMLDESLMDRLELRGEGGSATSAADLLVAHKFPLALGKRSLASLSPGERVRAALISLFRQSPPVELLVLDEPTYSLDRVGWHAMIEALRAFRGGLVVASHDRAFLDAVGIETYVELGGPSPMSLSVGR